MQSATVLLALGALVSPALAQDTGCEPTTRNVIIQQPVTATMFDTVTQVPTYTQLDEKIVYVTTRDVETVQVTETIKAEAIFSYES